MWILRELEVCPTGYSWVGDNIANVGHARYISNQAFKSQAETSVRYCAIASEVYIPFVGFSVHAVFLHASLQDVQAFFTLRATDDFTNAGCQYIHGSNSFAIIAKAHIESFDLSGVVFHDHRGIKVLFCQVALMLSL